MSDPDVIAGDPDAALVELDYAGTRDLAYDILARHLFNKVTPVSAAMVIIELALSILSMATPELRERATQTMFRNIRANLADPKFEPLLMRIEDYQVLH